MPGTVTPKFGWTVPLMLMIVGPSGVSTTTRFATVIVELCENVRVDVS